jgi:hypothetical protein
MFPLEAFRWPDSFKSTRITNLTRASAGLPSARCINFQPQVRIGRGALNQGSGNAFNALRGRPDGSLAARLADSIRLSASPCFQHAKANGLLRSRPFDFPRARFCGCSRPVPLATKQAALAAGIAARIRHHAQ